MSLENNIKKYFNESMKIESFSNTESEISIENYLIETIGNIDYFKKNRDNFGKSVIRGDINRRSNIWAYLDSGVKDTVILFHHHDTVDIENFGKLKNIAFDSEKLKKELVKINDEDLRKDIESGKWIFGRGSCDMKSALALQLSVLEEYSLYKNRKVNLLYLSVADEESYSAGMRSAVELLLKLREKFSMEYILAIDSEPFESSDENIKTLYLGTVGKLMPVIVTQGVVSHIKEPLKGINAASLMAKIAYDIDLNEKLSDNSLGNISPLPTISYMRDLKKIYNVTTVQRAAMYFSILDLKRTPAENIEILKEICINSADEYYEKYLKLKDRYKVDFSTEKPEVLTYKELLDLCREKEGFADFMRMQKEKTERKFRENTSFQDLAIENIAETLEFYGENRAIVVIGIAPPYYPSMNSRKIISKISIERLSESYRKYLEKLNNSLDIQEYFMGICDLSYCAIEKKVSDYEEVLKSMAVTENIYNLDFNGIKKLNIPGINLGPWGKDLHKETERVYEKDMVNLIPNYFLYLFENIEEIF